MDFSDFLLFRIIGRWRQNREIALMVSEFAHRWRDMRNDSRGFAALSDGYVKGI